MLPALKDVHRFAPRIASPLDSAVLVDGAPIVGQDKRDRLLNALRKTFTNAGFRVTTEAMEMPMNEKGESQGFLFIILDDPTAAEQASLALNNHPFDKRHTLSVLTFAEVDRIQTVEGDYSEEPLKPFQARVRLKCVTV